MFLVCLCVAMWPVQSVARLSPSDSWNRHQLLTTLFGLNGIGNNQIKDYLFRCSLKTPEKLCTFIYSWASLDLSIQLRACLWNMDTGEPQKLHTDCEAVMLPTSHHTIVFRSRFTIYADITTQFSFPDRVQDISVKLPVFISGLCVINLNQRRNNITSARFMLPFHAWNRQLLVLHWCRKP